MELAGGLIFAFVSAAFRCRARPYRSCSAWTRLVRNGSGATARQTQIKRNGYHRTGILAALLNALTLILIVGFIVYEAIGRLHESPTVTPTLMFVSAGAGIAPNLYVGVGLRGSSERNVNVRAAMLHVFGDVAASIGVIVAGITILLTRWYAADAVISLAIAVLIAKGAWDLMRETIDILMESAPKEINIAQLVRDLVRVPGVSDVHDLHVWSIAGGMNALSAHLAPHGRN